MTPTDNFKKHTHANPLQKLLLWNFYRGLLSLAAKLRVDSILDAGCGEGFTLQRLRQRRIGIHLEGIDRAAAALEIGKTLHPDIDLKQGDVRALPYADDCFDLVVCTEVLEHLPEPALALRELRRVSRRYLLVSVPNEPFFMMAQLARGKNWSRLGNDVDHVNQWTCRQFERFVRREGVKVLARRYPFPWTILLLEKGGP